MKNIFQLKEVDQAICVKKKIEIEKTFSIEVIFLIRQISARCFQVQNSPKCIESLQTIVIYGQLNVIPSLNCSNLHQKMTT